MALMAKEKKVKKVPLYVDVEESIKKRIDRLAEHRSRKLTAEVSIALRRYLDDEEEKEGLPPIEDE